MWKLYRSTILKYARIPLSEERRLITLAQKGSKKSAEEIVLRHIGFVIFRIYKRTFPEFLKRFGEDLLSDSIPTLYQKIKTYKLDYCDNRGNPKPVKFASYVWKRIDGFIVDSLKKEVCREKEIKQQILDGVAEVSSRCRPFGLYTSHVSYSRFNMSGGKLSSNLRFGCMTLRRRFTDFPSAFGGSV